MLRRVFYRRRMSFVIDKLACGYTKNFWPVFHWIISSRGSAARAIGQVHYEVSQTKRSLSR